MSTEAGGVPQKDLMAEAFGEGCDARLEGRPLSELPLGEGRDFVNYWKHGWLDVDRHWGLWASWPVPRLPDLQGGGGG